MNSINMVGKVIGDPAKSKSSSGLDMARIKIAVDKVGKDGNSNNYEIFEVLVFNALANMPIEIGQVIGVTGKLSSNNFEKEGKQYYNCTIVGNSINTIA